MMSFIPIFTSILHPKPDALFRLFMFPYAGADHGAYKEIINDMDGDIEVISLGLPGRGVLHDIDEWRDFPALIESLALTVVKHISDKPFAFFGHSFGALLAYEVCLKLCQWKMDLPSCLFISAHRAPDVSLSYGKRGSPIHQLPEEEFMRESKRWGLIADEIADNQELTKLVAICLRKDLELDETYRLHDKVMIPENVDFYLYGGISDDTITEDDLNGWGKFSYSKQNANIEWFEGSHFYFIDPKARKWLIESVRNRLFATLKKHGKSILSSSVNDGRSLQFTAVEQFFRQSCETPEAMALIDGDRQWCYRDLADAVIALAGRLKESGVVPHAIVGIFLEHSAEYVISILALHRLRATVCLLESNWSAGYIADFAASCGVRSVITSVYKACTVEAVDGCVAIIIDEEAERIVSSRGNANTDEFWIPPAMEDIAFVSMTSGSTGKPKAVLTTQRGCAYCFQARNDIYPYAIGDREGVNVFFAWEALRALLQGHTTVIIPDDVILDPSRLHSFIHEHRINRIVITPSLLDSLLDSPEVRARSVSTWDSLKYVFLMGEVVPNYLIEKASKHIPEKTSLINAYSTWESLDVSYADLSQPWRRMGQYASVGQIVAGTTAVIMGDRGNIVPQGVAGELVVIGPGVSPGYLGDDVLTEQRFLPIPDELKDVGVCGRSMYRTGDRARILQSGELVVLGRIDSTVKIRGFKVSLPAIEHVLNVVDGVAKALVVPILDDRTGQPGGLVAYVVGDSGKPSESVLARLRRHIRSHLPEYARPSVVIGLSEFPMRRGESRKLDRAALPPPIVERDVSVSGPELSALERQIARIWCDVLSVQEVHRNDNFFELGGNSLTAAKLVAALSSRLGLSLAVVDIYQYSTLSAMADYSLAGRQPTEPASTRKPVQGHAKLAIIGMAGRFPGAASVDAFWRNLVDGYDSLRRFTADELRRKHISEEILKHPAWVSAGQVIDDADKFDAPFWGIGRREATLMDPQHRIFMEIAWSALEQAGYARRDNPYRDRTSVYASYAA